MRKVPLHRYCLRYGDRRFINICEEVPFADKDEADFIVFAGWEGVGADEMGYVDNLSEALEIAGAVLTEAKQPDDILEKSARLENWEKFVIKYYDADSKADGAWEER